MFLLRTGEYVDLKIAYFRRYSFIRIVCSWPENWPNAYNVMKQQFLIIFDTWQRLDMKWKNGDINPVQYGVEAKIL